MSVESWTLLLNSLSVLAVAYTVWVTRNRP